MFLYYEISGKFIKHDFYMHNKFELMLAIKKCTVIIILKEFVCIDINVSYGIARHCTTFRCKFNIRIRRDTAFFVT